VLRVSYLVIMGIINIYDGFFKIIYIVSFILSAQ